MNKIISTMFWAFDEDVAREIFDKTEAIEYLAQLKNGLVCGFYDMPLKYDHGIWGSAYRIVEFGYYKDHDCGWDNSLYARSDMEA